jgi:uncharacterized membrane protein YadS
MYADDVVLSVATVTKLTRNLGLAAVIPLLTWMHYRQAHAHRRSERTPLKFKTLVPTFIIGFVAMAVLRTIGDATLQSSGVAFGLLDGDAWRSLVNQVGDFWASRVFLGTAMAAVGLSTSFAVFKGVGGKPFAVGFAGALVVGAVGLLMAVIFGRYVSL